MRPVLAKRRSEDEIEMPPHNVGEGALLTVAREALEQFKIVESLVHVSPKGCRHRWKTEIYLQE